MLGCCCGFCGTAMSTVNTTPGICQNPCGCSTDGGAFSLSNALNGISRLGTSVASTVRTVQNSVAPANSNVQAQNIGNPSTVSTTTLLIVAAVVIALIFIFGGR
jgi:hypothetical protein